MTQFYKKYSAFESTLNSPIVSYTYRILKDHRYEMAYI